MYYASLGKTKGTVKNMRFTFSVFRELDREYFGMSAVPVV